MGVLQPNPKVQINSKTNSYKLDEMTSSKLENGVLINSLADKLL